MNDEFLALIAKGCGMTVAELKEDWIIMELLGVHYKNWEESNRDAFYVDMGTEDVWSVLTS